MSRRALVIGAAVLCGACGGGRRAASTVPASPPPRTCASAPAAPASVPSATTTAPAPAPRPRPAPSPGSLPQTDQLPSAATAQFHAEMAALWDGVVNDDLADALPAFFPEGAYVQVKGISDPRADYTDRLLGDYRLDLGAAHALLGASAAGAQLLRVQVPQGYAHWVSPGACYNTVGYYEVPNARMVYRQAGQVRSFGIASMISWRGVWYVVHLGAVLRASAAGVVDDPSAGPGESTPSSTC